MSACVLAAIDLGPSSARVLRHAAGFARLLSAPLRVLHVAIDATPAQTKKVLAFCAANGPYEVDLTEHEVIVRTGLVSDRNPARRPGAIASAVLRTTRAFVLAVPQEGSHGA